MAAPIRAVTKSMVYHPDETELAMDAIKVVFSIIQKLPVERLLFRQSIVEVMTQNNVSAPPPPHPRPTPLPATVHPPHAVPSLPASLLRQKAEQDCPSCGITRKAVVANPDYCPACEAGHEAGILLGFTTGMVRKADGLPHDAPLPAGTGGTIPIARQALIRMMEHLKKVPSHYPHVQNEATAVAEAAVPVAEKLRFVNNVGEARALHAEVEKLHALAYELPIKAKAKQ